MWSSFKSLAVPALRAANAAAAELLAEENHQDQGRAYQVPTVNDGTFTTANNRPPDTAALDSGRHRSHANGPDLQNTADGQFVQSLPGAWVTTPPPSPVRVQERDAARQDSRLPHHQITGSSEDREIPERQHPSQDSVEEKENRAQQASQSGHGHSHLQPVPEGSVVRHHINDLQFTPPMNEAQRTLQTTSLELPPARPPRHIEDHAPRSGQMSNVHAADSHGVHESSRPIGSRSASGGCVSSSSPTGTTSRTSGTAASVTLQPQTGPSGADAGPSHSELPVMSKEFIIKNLSERREERNGEGETLDSIQATISQKRPRSPLTSISSCNDCSSSEEDGSDVTTPVGPRKKRNKSGPQSLYVANVEETAMRVQPSTSDLANATIIKIQRMLSRAESGNEHEARIALKRATEQMNVLNISTAEVLSHSEDKTAHAGHSIVAIRRRDNETLPAVRFAQWNYDLANAIEIFFATKYTTSQDQCLYFEFYGIAENTVAAAHAFEMVFNDISRWAMDHKGPARNSYGRGVCKTLWEDAMHERKEEERSAQESGQRETARRVREEEEHRQAELNRLMMPTDDDVDNANESDHDMDLQRSPADSGWCGNKDDNNGEDDSDDDVIDYGCIQNFLGLVSTSRSTPPAPTGAMDTVQIPQPAPNDTTKPQAEPEPQWKSKMQIIKFRQDAEQLADDYMRNVLKLTVGTSRKSQAQKFDAAAYNKGRKDGKKIDVRRKAIKDSPVEIL